MELNRRLPTLQAGYYGKPLGIAKPKIPEFDVPLVLDLMEGLYLVENKKIEIYENTESEDKSQHKKTQTKSQATL